MHTDAEWNVNEPTYALSVLLYISSSWTDKFRSIFFILLRIRGTSTLFAVCSSTLRIIPIGSGNRTHSLSISPTYSQEVYNVRLAMSYVLSPSTLSSVSHANNPTTPSLSPSPSPNTQHLLRPSSSGLLIPTDRTQDVLETKWMGILGRLRVEREVTLKGYALYSLRSWWV